MVKIRTMTEAGCISPRMTVLSIGLPYIVRCQVQAALRRRRSYTPSGMGRTDLLILIVDVAIRGAVSTQLLDPDSEIVSIYYKRIERGNPTPTVGRDAIIQKSLDMLKAEGIYSRGCFGAWKYEVGDSDHCVSQGAEAVEAILRKGNEYTLRHPRNVSGEYNVLRRFNLTND